MLLLSLNVSNLREKYLWQTSYSSGTTKSDRKETFTLSEVFSSLVWLRLDPERERDRRVVPLE